MWPFTNKTSIRVPKELQHLPESELREILETGINAAIKRSEDRVMAFLAFRSDATEAAERLVTLKGTAEFWEEAGRVFEGIGVSLADKLNEWEPLGKK